MIAQAVAQQAVVAAAAERSVGGLGALHLAAYQGHTPLVALLADAGLQAVEVTPRTPKQNALNRLQKGMGVTSATTPETPPSLSPCHATGVPYKINKTMSKITRGWIVDRPTKCHTNVKQIIRNPFKNNL